MNGLGLLALVVLVVVFGLAAGRSVGEPIPDAERERDDY